MSDVSSNRSGGYHQKDNLSHCYTPPNWTRQTRTILKHTMISLFLTYAIILMLDGVEHLKEWIVAATVIPIVVTPPLVYNSLRRKIQIQRLNAELIYALNHDHLTKANTRQSLIDYYGKTKGQRALIMLDADHFKSINDRYGHLVGDQALKFLTNSIRQQLRSGDMVSRFGGEEFVILLSDTNEQGAIEVCSRLKNDLNTTLMKGPEGEIPVTLSMGLTMCIEGEDIDEAIGRADEAVFRAKKAGRNQMKIARMIREVPQEQALSQA